VSSGMSFGVFFWAVIKREKNLRLLSNLQWRWIIGVSAKFYSQVVHNAQKK